MIARATLVLAVCAAALAAAGPASAELGPPQLVSASALEQADAVTTPAVSADGRHIVFGAQLGGRAGIFRKDLGSGAIDLVAGADAYNKDPAGDARWPSVSADGRYVSFTTSAALDPVHDVNTAPDVYVRDMACDPAAPCAYTLASARDGALDGLAYDDASLGSVAAPRSALSADGRTVAFVVRSPSDLTSGAGGATPGVTTPAGQVAVRYLDAGRTVLVSSIRDASTGAMTGLPVPGGAVEPVQVDPGAGLADGGGVAVPVAALSADGSTVAWLGMNIRAQAPMLRDEHDPGSASYDEPLWRRVADGPTAPTRRVIGGGDPLAPGCSTDSSIDDAPCQGPYPHLGQFAGDRTAGWVDRPANLDALPALSADGRTVGLIGSPFGTPDLSVVDMHDGLTRRQALRQLTQASYPDNDDGDVIYDVGVSPDGSRIAFTTARHQFLLQPPFVVGGTPSQQGLSELYVIDLGAQTLRRLSVPADGGASGPGIEAGVGAGSPTFSAANDVIAFSSTAANLVPVDGNGGNDAFVITDRAVPAGRPGVSAISAAPSPPSVPVAWRMGLRAVAQRDGTVRIDAVCPGGGVLRATVQATVPVTRTVVVPPRHGHKRRTVRKRVLIKRRVAVASKVVRAPGLLRLTLKATKAYTSLVKARAGLDASARVTFSAPRRKALVDELDVRFRVVPKKKPPAKRQPAPDTKGKAKR